MKRICIHIVILFCFLNGAFAQEVLIRQFPGLDTIPKKYGPNRESYTAALIGYGHLFGPTDSSGSNVNVPRSIYITYGMRSKTKISEGFNLGFDFFFEYRNFNISQSDNKTIFGIDHHRRERYIQGTINAGLFMRFNFSKRGNHLGKYLDLFGNVMYSPINRYIVHDRLPDSTGAKLQKTVLSRLQFAQKWSGQVGLRYGISFFQIQAFYRPFNLFKNSTDYPYPELPRFGLGILIDIDQSEYNKN